MEYTTRRIEVSRRIVRAQEKRVAQQRQKVALALADRDAADELQARLLVMEQSLIAMTRFLKTLERDLKGSLSIHGYATEKRFKDRRQAARRVTMEQAADRFALQATASVLAPDANIGSLDALAKAMRPLGRR